jgi:threonine dehydrogenase-like Zn-dependent dehydrogenase
MPRELIAVAPRTPVLRDYDEPPLAPADIRIRTELASPKHGTELVTYRDDPVSRRVYDADWGAMVDAGNDETRFPMRLGNMAVGTVTEIGPEVTRFRQGDRVFGHFPIRETQTVDESRADLLPEGLSPEAALCLDPVVMALAMRDGGIKLGDRVAVFGLGAIGLVAVQLARLAGASIVIAVDPLANRRDLALAYGADVALDPTADGGDVGMAIRALTRADVAFEQPDEPRRITGGYVERATQAGNLGVDVAVETSGSVAALQGAIRSARYGGTVCIVSYYGRDAAGLMLGEEFHINRLQLVSARSQSLPLRDAPAWRLERTVDLSLQWMIEGRIRTEGIISPIVPFAESADAYRMIDEHPERAIKLGIRFD